MPITADELAEFARLRQQSELERNKPFGCFGNERSWTPTKPEKPQTEKEFYQEVLAALDKLPQKRLGWKDLYDKDARAYCALGAWVKYFVEIDPKTAEFICDASFEEPRMRRLAAVNDSLDMSARDRWHAVRQWLLDTLAEMNEEKANDN